MSFMEEVLSRNMPIWDRCIAAPFVQDLKRGSLRPESFKIYMIQDSIYLKNYARIYGKAIYHATTLKDIQLYYSILGFVTDAESAVRLNYLKRFGMTDGDIESVSPLPETRSYIEFLFQVAERGNSLEILMAVLPCMLSYSYIFRKIAAEPESLRSGYRDFIQDYADSQYAEDCRKWCAYADRKCENLSAPEHTNLHRIFEKASLLELDFWNMVYRLEGGAHEKGTEHCGF